MNKLTKKLGVLFLGMVTALGIGLTGGAEKKGVKAEELTSSISCTAGTIVSNTMTFKTADDAFTIVHAKGSDSNFASYSSWRVYTANTVTFTPNIEILSIKKIAITADTAAYATAAQNGTIKAGANSSAGTVTGKGSVSGSVATIDLSSMENVQYVNIKPSAQSRWASIVITYETATVDLQPDADAFMLKVDALVGKVTVDSGADIAALEEEYAELAEGVQVLVDAADYVAKMAQIKADYATALESAADEIADAFMEQVDALVGNVAATDGEKIDELETVYATYTGTVKDLIDGAGYVAKMTQIKIDYEAAVEAVAVAADQAKADEFMVRVDALHEKEITVDDAATITGLENEYALFSERVKTFVNSAGYVAKMVEIKAAHKAADDAAKQALADVVIDMIAELPAVELLVPGDAAKVKEARAAYEALAAAVQAFVTNLEDLVAAEAKIKEISPTYEIAFTNALSSDGSTGLNSTTFQTKYPLPTGLSLSAINGYIYEGKGSTLKVSSGSNNGTFTLAVGSDKYITSVVVTASKYGSDTGTIKVNSGAAQTVPATVGELEFDISAQKTNLAKFDFTARSYIHSIVIGFATLVSEISVTGVEITPATLDLDLGGTATIAVNVLPSNATDGTYALVSDDESVATVTSAGLVTAVGIGEATITATTNDGAKTATCAVKVLAPATIKKDVTASFPGGAGLTFDTDFAGLKFHVTYGEHVYRAYTAEKGAQMGSATTTGEIKFATKIARFNPGDVERVAVTASLSSATGVATLKVMVGGTQIGETVNLTNTSTQYIFEGAQVSAVKRALGEDAGALEIITSGNGVCFKSFSVYGAAEEIALAQSTAVTDFLAEMHSVDTCEDFELSSLLREMYDDLTAEEQALVDLQTYTTATGTEETIMSKLAYMELLAAQAEAEAAGSQSLLDIVSSDNMTAIIVIAVLGLSALLGYYILEKKKLVA